MLYFVGVKFLVDGTLAMTLLGPSSKLMAASKMKGKHSNDVKNYIRKDFNDTINPDLSACDFNFGDIAWVRTGSYAWWPAQVIDEKSVGPSSKPRKKAESEVLIRLYGTYNYLYIDRVKNNEEFENTMKQNNSGIREMLEKALEEDLSRIKSHRKTKGNLPPSKGKSRGGTLENLHQDEVKEHKVKKKTGSEVSQNQDRKPRAKQQDATKLEQDEVKEHKVKEQTVHVTSNQRVEKKRKLTEKTQPEVLKWNSQTQDCERKSQQQDVTKNDRVDVHGSVKRAQVEKTRDASARRMKVMQSLALIAPSGSPFHKHGHVKATSSNS